MNWGCSLILAAALSCTLAAHADNEVIALKANRNLAYGKIAYILGGAIDAQMFADYAIYSHKDHCWFRSYPNDTVLSYLSPNELAILVPLAQTAMGSPQIELRVTRADGSPLGRLQCFAITNPPPETLDDLKAFLQIQFGAAATVQ